MVLLALPITLFLCLVTAPFSSPDEQHHAARAIALAHGEWMARVGPTGEAGAEIDANALRVMDAFDTYRMAWEAHSPDFRNRHYGVISDEQQTAQAGVRWAGRRVFAAFPNTSVYPPTFYLPAAAGWRIGEAANLTILQSLHLARMLCALTAVLLGWLSLRVCAFSRWVLLPFLLLPSVLFLNAGCSQDAVMLSVAALIAAMTTRPLVQERDFSKVELVVVAILLGLCATARPPYLAMSLVLFLPGTALPRWDVRGGLRKALGVVFVLAAAGWWRHLVLPLGVDPSDVADPARQMEFVRQHPLRAAWTILGGTSSAAVDLARRGLYVVGWNDLVAPTSLMLVLAALLGVMLLATPATSLRRWRTRGILLVSIAATLIGVSFAEYVIWTPPGGAVVYGVQPRYWLAVLPFATMLLQDGLAALGGWLVLSAKIRGRLLQTATVGLGMVAWTLPWVACQAFYREGLAHVLRLNLR